MTTQAWKKWAAGAALVGVASGGVLAGCNGNNGGPRPVPAPIGTPLPLNTPTPNPRATAGATARPIATATAQPGATATGQPNATSTPRPAATNTPTGQATATPRPVANAFYPGSYTLSAKPILGMGGSFTFTVGSNGVIVPKDVTGTGVGNGQLSGSISPSGVLVATIKTVSGSVAFNAPLSSTGSAVSGSGDVVLNLPGSPGLNAGTFTVARE